ncbi:MAG: hypothetical protein CO186_00680 [Zetaproteobacteria bacterium CG_4_9_14_3_um_filter_49_83]|nr:MAG: hypothetical protein AUJ56_11535 [Zetaproteobacteria bacterium CG1_02_49_23]PIQ31806.1 MAG: hypothetical protein COW62_08800 [Zetaproteobacteria bacterium CG17_big_fil_post_rev_8_21_14_2_50_50_13]PIV30268.1 MAG: hypothetical protein COS35_07615 [Zetaproteobacteria bacterium CG02_land_8_20_14_3_00_50_9]PIY56169.1 MAG: hypothetical protein COZ00_05640 [Zetaproteobacteria bacterium CG_4_10_14_0_8_um_filter_49_80]PJA36447.1 MAG: hypothetical protein CO186_00680 [Zetaproteobacteria bacterium
MYYVVAVAFPTPEPERSAQFLKNRLNFNIKYEHDSWWAENGSTSLHLIQGDGSGVLEIQCSDIVSDSRQLLAFPELEACTELTKHQQQLTQELQCDCGFKLCISKALNEDERDEIIALTTTLPWDEMVRENVQRILLITPLAFRDSARKKVAERAEYITVEGGELTVGLAQAMQALVEITLKFQHPALYEAMLQQNINASQYLNPKSWEKEV